MDLGLLAALMGAFANDDARLFLGGRFDGEGMTVPLLFPAASAAICACSARSPGPRSRTAPATYESARRCVCSSPTAGSRVDQTVGEMRISLGERARNPNEGTSP